MKPEEIIKEARERKRFTQTDVADKLGVGLRMYQKIEAGQFPKYKREQISKLDEILGTSVYELIYETKDEKSYNYNAVPTGMVVREHRRGKNEMEELSSGMYRLKTKLILHKAQAGYLTGWGDEEYLEDLPEHEIIIDKPVAGEYISFEARGDSMDDGSKDSIEDKSIVTGRKIDRKYWRNKLHLKKFQDFIIVCNNTTNCEGGILIKRIVEHNTDENYIVCRSLNPDKEMYPDFKIQLIDIMQIFNVVQVTRKY